MHEHTPHILSTKVIYIYIIFISINFGDIHTKLNIILAYISNAKIVDGLKIKKNIRATTSY